MQTSCNTDETMTKVFVYLCVLLVTSQHATTQPNHDLDPAYPDDDTFDLDLFYEYIYSDDLDPCTPDCLGRPPGSLTPDPRNCHRYYTCLADDLVSDFVSTCPDDYKFDAVTLTCSPDFGNVTCGTCEPACAFDCPTGDITFIASRFNCSEYVLCGMGEQDPIQCSPETPFFDGAQCQGDEDLCCESCQVFCWSAFTEVADPEDCEWFYYCSEDNYFPGESDRYKCPEGELFHKGGCVLDDGSVACEEPCM